MIPKIIHYCWFGRGEKPALAQKCIASWRKFCPDYKIIEWNEENCDLASAPLFPRQAYEVGKYSFTSDYYRLKAVYDHGGIYLDTDVELLKTLDSLLENQAFFGFDEGGIATGLGFGAEKGATILSELMRFYETSPFLKPDGSWEVLPCTYRDGVVFRRHGLKMTGAEQSLDDGKIHIYPTDYFAPKRCHSFFTHKTSRTISIHHGAQSWMPKEDLFRYRMKELFSRLPWDIAQWVLPEKLWLYLKDLNHRRK